MNFKLGKLTIEKLNVKINLEKIFRCALIAYFVFVPAKGGEQAKPNIEPKIEIKKPEQLPKEKQKQTKRKIERKFERRK